MYNNETTDKYIEELRDKLNKLLLTNDFDPIEVLKLSRELDKQIAEYYAEINKCS